MMPQQLTRQHRAAMNRPVGSHGRGAQRNMAAIVRILPLVAGSVLLAGCISVAAPDKPIVIELNINIRSEVVYRLAADADKTIEENTDIF